MSIDAGRARRIAGEPGIGKIPAAGNLVLNAMDRRRSLRAIVAKRAQFAKELYGVGCNF